jgi:hypothetical protein
MNSLWRVNPTTMQHLSSRRGGLSRKMIYLKGRGLDGIVPLDDLREVAMFRLSRRLRVVFECLIGPIAMIGVALVIAVAEARCDFAQIILADWLTAQRTKRFWAGCPAVDQEEQCHTPPPPTISVTLRETDVLLPLRSMLRST